MIHLQLGGLKNVPTRIPEILVPKSAVTPAQVPDTLVLQPQI
jgi:hypothetical protein